MDINVWVYDYSLISLMNIIPNWKSLLMIEKPNL